MKRNIPILTVTILLLFFASACSSSKNGGRNIVTRTVDDLVARDNGYFNARLIMKENEKTLWDGQTEDFENILPVFKYGTQDQSSSVQPAMDEAIKKCSFVIQMHKKSKWVDDCYFLIGKADFYKRNYDDALTSFQYIVSEYSDIITKQSKSKHIKEDEDGELTFFEKFKHQPVASEAGIWVARCLVEKKKFSEAHTVISVLRSRENFPSWLKGELDAVEADCYMKEQQNANAIEPLIAAVEHTDDKQLKARYNFILAQLYAEQKSNEKAMAAYQQVLDSKPTYDMDFYAKLNMAKLSMSNFGVSGKESKNELLALLKDEKYKDFYGLIYSTLADMALADKDEETGIDYLNLSVRFGSDDKQKAQSYLRLGDIYYSHPDYKNAYAYYDSSLAILPHDEVRYTDVKKLHDDLKLLVDQLTIIETEKKLQYWAGLSEKELEKELEKIIPEPTDTSGTNAGNNTPNTNNTQVATAGTEGDFYFYNTTLRSRGFSEFKKNFGTRKLEDNWRRSEKGNFNDGEETVEDTSKASTIDLSKNVTMQAIIDGLPKTPVAIAASNAKIAAALYRAGVVYKENFLNKPKAVDCFTENVTDYRDNKFEMQSYYQLYRLTGNPKQAMYKDSLLTKYPESDYARIIADPDYFVKIEEKKHALENYYAQTYDLLQQKNYTEVRSRTAAADSLFNPNPLKPKFEMLAVLTLAGDSTDAFKNGLQKIALKYPENEVGIRAQEILDYLRRGSVIKDASKTTETTYTYKDDEEQYFLFVMNSTGKDATTMKNNTATFNATNFGTDNLKISSLLLGKENSIILVKSFSSAQKAMTYYFTIKDNPGVYKDLTKDAFTPMVISKSNYVLFFKSKDIDGYEVFFQDNYIKE